MRATWVWRHACSPENGAQVVKTYYCDENFEQVTAGCPVPTVIAGGKKLPEREALEMAYRAVDQGAAGVDMGRNIFQSEHPAAMIQAVRAVVHQVTSDRKPRTSSTGSCGTHERIIRHAADVTLSGGESWATCGG